MLHAFLLASDPNSGRPRVYVVAEPGVVALLVYAACRLLPTAVAGDFGFTTFEPAHTTLRENKQARVVGTYSRLGLDRGDAEALRRRGYVIDTVAESYSPGLEVEPSWPLEPLIRLASEGDWGAVEEIQALWRADPGVVPGATPAVLAEGPTVRPLAAALRDGGATPEGLVALRRTRVGDSLLRGPDVRGRAWQVIRPAWSDPAVAGAFSDLLSEHRAELLDELARRAAAGPPGPWLGRWRVLKPLLDPSGRGADFARLLARAGGAPGAAGLPVADRLRLIEEWAGLVGEAGVPPAEMHWLLQPEPGVTARELILSKSLRPATAGVAVCLALADGGEGPPFVEALPADRFAGFLAALERFPGRAAVIARLFPKGQAPPASLADRLVRARDGRLAAGAEGLLLAAGCDAPEWIPYWRAEGRLEDLMGRLDPRSPLAGRVLSGVADGLGPESLVDPAAGDGIAALKATAGRFPGALGPEVAGRLDAWALLQRVYTEPGKSSGSPSAIRDACLAVGHPPDALANRLFRLRVRSEGPKVAAVAAAEFLRRVHVNEGAALDAALSLADGLKGAGTVRRYMFEAIVSPENWNRLLDEHGDRLSGAGLEPLAALPPSRTRNAGASVGNSALKVGPYEVPRRTFELGVLGFLGLVGLVNLGAVVRLAAVPAVQDTEAFKAESARAAAAAEEVDRAKADLEESVNEIRGLRDDLDRSRATERVQAEAGPIRSRADARAVALASGRAAAVWPEGAGRKYAREVQRLADGLDLAPTPNDVGPLLGFQVLPWRKGAGGLLVVGADPGRTLRVLPFEAGGEGLKWEPTVPVPGNLRFLATSDSGETSLIEDNQTAYVVGPDRLAGCLGPPGSFAGLSSFSITLPEPLFAVSGPLRGNRHKYAVLSLNAEGSGIWDTNKQQVKRLVIGADLQNELSDARKERRSPRLSFNARADRLVVGVPGGRSLYVFDSSDNAENKSPVAPIKIGGPVSDWAHGRAGPVLFYVKDNRVCSVDLAAGPPGELKPAALTGFGDGLTSPRSLAVSPNGKFLAVGDASGTVHLGSLGGTGKPSVTPLLQLGHEAAVIRLGFGPDGNALAALVENDRARPGKGVVRVWRTVGWDPPAVPVPASSAATAVF